MSARVVEVISTDLTTEQKMSALIKYPKTLHLEGSGLSAARGDKTRVPWSALHGVTLFIEEKLDGTQVGFFFDEQDQLTLQSRGARLDPGALDDGLELLWHHLMRQEVELYEALGRRFICFGEWLRTKHTVYYDALPCPFLEFDLYDRHQERFLSTPARRAQLAGTELRPVPVLWSGAGAKAPEPSSLLAPSVYKSASWRATLERAALERGVAPEVVWAQTDRSDYGEGLYIKAETDGETIGRYKYVREDFIRHIIEGGEHWRAQAMIPNGYADELGGWGLY